MIIVGLTGGIASGKSTTSTKFRAFGDGIIDCDLIAREVVQPGRPALTKIVSAFGSHVLREDGTLDRTRLGSIIFADEDKRRRLNSITHKYILQEIFWQIICHFWHGTKLLILDAPLLFESKKLIYLCQSIVVVYCNEEAQLQRLIKRDGIVPDEARKRIRAQMPIEQKRKLATHVIDNTMDPSQLDNKVKQVRQKVAQFTWLSRFFVQAKGIFLSLVTTVILYMSLPIYLYFGGSRLRNVD